MRQRRGTQASPRKYFISSVQHRAIAKIALSTSFCPLDQERWISRVTGTWNAKGNKKKVSACLL